MKKKKNKGNQYDSKKARHKGKNMGDRRKNRNKSAHPTFKALKRMARHERYTTLLAEERHRAAVMAKGVRKMANGIADSVSGFVDMWFERKALEDALVMLEVFDEEDEEDEDDDESYEDDEAGEDDEDRTE